MSDFFFKVTNYKVSVIIDENPHSKIQMEISNVSDYVLELLYEIPHYRPPNEIYLSAIYRNVQKEAKIIFSENNDYIKFDDEVANDNYVINIEQNECSIALHLSNFLPYEKTFISIEMAVSLIKDENNYYFLIPQIEKYNAFIHPNYSISFQISSDNINLKEIAFQYNNEIHRHSITNIANFQAENISPQHSLILKMPPKNSGLQQIDFLLDPLDILIFVDCKLCEDEYIRSSIIKFLKNYADYFKFNIIKYGSHRAYFHENMTSNGQKEIYLAEEFLKKSNSTESEIDFTNAYSDIVGNCCDESLSKYKLSSEQVKKTVAVCIGSIYSEKKIVSRTIPTFMIDPSISFDTLSFAKRHRFVFLGPYTNTPDEISISFELLIKKLRMSGNSINNQYYENDQNLYLDDNKFDYVENQSFNIIVPTIDFKSYSEEIKRTNDDFKENISYIPCISQNNNDTIKENNTISKTHENENNWEQFTGGPAKIVKNNNIFNGEQTQFIVFDTGKPIYSDRTYTNVFNIPNVPNTKLLKYHYDNFNQTISQDDKKMQEQVIQNLHIPYEEDPNFKNQNIHIQKKQKEPNKENKKIEKKDFNHFNIQQYKNHLISNNSSKEFLWTSKQPDDLDEPRLNLKIVGLDQTQRF